MKRLYLFVRHDLLALPCLCLRRALFLRPVAQFARAVSALVVAFSLTIDHSYAQGVDDDAAAATAAMSVDSVASEESPTPMMVVRNVNAALEVERLSRQIVFRTEDKRGRVRERTTTSFRRDFDDERRLVMFFTAPASIRDTAVLTLDYPATTADDQWLYLPALRRVRRVPSADRGADFLNTDFSFEDMKLDGGLSTDDYDYAFLPDSNEAAFRLVATPKTPQIAKELGYSRNEITVDPATWAVVEVVFWDEDGELLKTLTVKDIRMVGGRPTRHFARMDNHRSGGATELLISDVDYETEVSESVFTQQALRRGL